MSSFATAGSVCRQIGVQRKPLEQILRWWLLKGSRSAIVLHMLNGEQFPLDTLRHKELENHYQRIHGWSN